MVAVAGAAEFGIEMDGGTRARETMIEPNFITVLCCAIIMPPKYSYGTDRQSWIVCCKE